MKLAKKPACTCVIRDYAGLPVSRKMSGKRKKKRKKEVQVRAFLNGQGNFEITRRVREEMFISLIIGATHKGRICSLWEQIPSLKSGPFLFQVISLELLK